MSRLLNNPPEHLSLEPGPNDGWVRYAFTAHDMWADLNVKHVSDEMISTWRVLHPRAYSLVMAFRAYRALLNRAQIAAKASDGFDWVWENDLAAEMSRQINQLTQQTR